MSDWEKQHSSRLGASQVLALGAASVQSSAFAGQTRQIRVASTGACHIRVDSNPTAVATDPLLPAAFVDYITVTPGQKIAVIQDGAATGNLSVTEMT